jgi:hypothetical protein
MSHIIRLGGMYRVMDEKEVEVCGDLPPQVYTVSKTMTGEFFLETIDTFTMPKKLYGNTARNAERVLNTFQQRPFSTGVHLDGVKGSGKTLLAKCISIEAQKRGMPTIVINQPYHGDDFNKFIQAINTPAVILFDEFEKVYGWGEQEKILTLLDGVYPSKKLFIITSNESNNVTRYLKNRPGRIYYAFKFDTIEKEFVREYCEDNLIDKTQIESVVRYTSIFSFFNFDMLAAAIEEMNRYGETLKEVLTIMNIVPETKSTDSYVLKVVSGNMEKVVEQNYREFSPTDFNYYVNVGDELDVFKQDAELYNVLEEAADPEGDIHFKSEMISNYDQNRQSFVYSFNAQGKELHLVCEKIDKPAFNLNSLAW